MCRERDVERQMGDADLLTSVQPPTRMEGGGTKPPNNKLLSVRLPASNPMGKEQERENTFEESNGFARPALAPRKTSAQSPRLLPYFPKSAVTSPPQPKSFAPIPSAVSRATARNPPPARATTHNPSAPAPRTAPRNPSPTPAPRATARHPSPSAVPASRATARNPSPVPGSRATARNPSPVPGSRATARNPSPVPASRAIARNPSPSPVPASRATARNPSPVPSSRAPARNPSPAPAASRAPARNPSPAAKSAARSASPAPSKPFSNAAAAVSQTSPSTLKPAMSSSNKILPPVRRSSSPAVGRKEPRASANGGTKISTPDGARRAPGVSSMLFPSSKQNVLSTSCSSDGSSSKDEFSPESPTISGKKTSTLEDLQALRKHRMVSSMVSAGFVNIKKVGAPKAGRVACEGMLSTSPVAPVDTKRRCHWITPQSEPAIILYHDEEWGVPVHNDKILFELLVLEGAQSELSRPQMLGLRDHFREVYASFDPEIVATFDEKKIAALAADDVIRQPEAKVRGVVENAKQIVKITQEFGSWNKYVWMFVGYKPMVNTPRLPNQVPVKSSKSEALSRDLMRRGFRYVGPTTIYSFMQAAGMVNDHLASCFRHSQCCSPTSQTVAESSEKRVF